MWHSTRQLQGLPEQHLALCLPGGHLQCVSHQPRAQPCCLCDEWFWKWVCQLVTSEPRECFALQVWW